MILDRVSNSWYRTVGARKTHLPVQTQQGAQGRHHRSQLPGELEKGIGLGRGSGSDV